MKDIVQKMRRIVTENTALFPAGGEIIRQLLNGECFHVTDGHFPAGESRLDALDNRSINIKGKHTAHYSYSLISVCPWRRISPPTYLLLKKILFILHVASLKRKKHDGNMQGIFPLFALLLIKYSGTIPKRTTC
jgi:hypothetical protein